SILETRHKSPYGNKPLSLREAVPGRCFQKRRNEMPTYTAAEMFHMIENSRPKTRWGRWNLVRDIGVLQFREEPGRGTLYEIDLDHFHTRAAVLDRLFH